MVWADKVTAPLAGYYDFRGKLYGARNCAKEEMMDDDEIEPKTGKSGKVAKGPKPPKEPKPPAGKKSGGMKVKAGHVPKISSIHAHVKGKDPGNLFKRGKPRGRG